MRLHCSIALHIHRAIAHTAAIVQHTTPAHNILYHMLCYMHMLVSLSMQYDMTMLQHMASACEYDNLYIVWLEIVQIAHSDKRHTIT